MLLGGGTAVNGKENSLLWDQAASAASVLRCRGYFCRHPSVRSSSSSWKIELYQARDSNPLRSATCSDRPWEEGPSYRRSRCRGGPRVGPSGMFVVR